MKNKDKKEWRDVKGFEGCYKVSDHGDICRIRYINCDEFVIVKKINSTKAGIVVLQKTENSKITRKSYIVKTLIYDCFHETRKGIIKCKDGDIENLSINNLVETDKRTAFNGLTKGEIKTILKMDKNKKSTKEIAKLIGCSLTTVRNHINNSKK